VEINTYATLEVHTKATIAAGREEVRKFASLMKVCVHFYNKPRLILLQEYITLTVSQDLSAKNWNFPKMHSTYHLFNDIEAKGATRNYNTKINEKLHGPLKESYCLHTNFKQVAGQVCLTFIWLSTFSPCQQILRADHWCYVAALVR